jgi:ligand-binding SRPBCC domain-containing protein
MKVYHLHQKQFLPLTLEEAWTFFSSPLNLVKITPPNMDFKILHTSGSGPEMYAGQIISYKIKFLPLVYFRWVTEITHVQPNQYFIDDQVFGPYALWHHQHHFKKVNGGVEMTDEITYAIPFGFIGRLANFLFVENQLENIFKFRRTTLDKVFVGNEPATNQLA